jgi:hypothetical protein
MNAVLIELRKWNTKHLENHSNTLAVDLLNNSETTHRLKRYTVLTLPDRPAYNSNTRIKLIPKWTKRKAYISYATGHNSFTSQYLLNVCMCLLQVLQIMYYKCVKGTSRSSPFRIAYLHVIAADSRCRRRCADPGHNASVVGFVDGLFHTAPMSLVSLDAPRHWFLWHTRDNW